MSLFHHSGLVFLFYFSSEAFSMFCIKFFKYSSAFLYCCFSNRHKSTVQCCFISCLIQRSSVVREGGGVNHQRFSFHGLSSTIINLILNSSDVSSITIEPWYFCTILSMETNPKPWAFWSSLRVRILPVLSRNSVPS